jgi:hypothetical protein
MRGNHERCKHAFRKPQETQDIFSEFSADFSRRLGNKPLALANRNPPALAKPSLELFPQILFDPGFLEVKLLILQHIIPKSINRLIYPMRLLYPMNPCAQNTKIFLIFRLISSI